MRVTVNGRQLDVRVPKGIQPGKVIRLNGQGSYARHLLLEIEYAPHPQFEVDGHNILHTVQVTPWQAALGTSISVPTLGGSVELKVPPDSDAGRKLRLRGRGLPGPPPGDQIVEVGNHCSFGYKRDTAQGISGACQSVWREGLNIPSVGLFGIERH